MAKWIALTVMGLLLVGCAGRGTDGGATVPPGSFVEHWRANLETRKEKLEGLYLVGDQLLCYGSDNTVWALSAAGGQGQAIAAVAPGAPPIGPPMIRDAQYLYTAGTTIEQFNRFGRRERSIGLGRQIQSPGTIDERLIYVGLDYPGQSRFAAVDTEAPYMPIAWEFITSGALTTAPVATEDGIFFGTRDGRVYAVTRQRTGLWLLEDSSFATRGPIADGLALDDTTVYAASGDSVLYALERATGRVRWRYFAGQPLVSGPVVRGERLYQHVPDKGLVALSTREGELSREPLWVAAEAGPFLAQDDRYIYARSGGGVIALDARDGTIAFRTGRSDLRLFAANAAGSIIYAATTQGEVLAIRPILRPGTVGQLVAAPSAMPALAAAIR